MNRVLRGVRHVALALLVVATLGGTLAFLPGESWAQQLVRATITNATLAVTQSGTWTVQPGNTANTTAWLVTGTGGVFPSSQSGAWSVTADTELPAAATLADNTSNPSLSAIAAYMFCYDDTNWDRCRSSVDATQGSTVQTNGPQVMFEAINFDGTASPTTVSEGQSIRPKATPSGIGLSMLTSADGSVSPQATIGSTPVIRVALFDDSNQQITAFGGSGGTASNFGSAFPTPGTAVGFSDGTNMQGARVGDLDTDAGEFWALWAVPCVGTTSGCSQPAYGSGATSALVPRMTLASDDPAVVALQAIDDWDESDRAKVNLIVGQAGITAGAGNVAANTPRFTLAADDSLVARRSGDPCFYGTKTPIPINISTATTTELTPSLAGASNHYYVCAINIGPVAGAQNFALVDDDTDNCASVTSGLAGGTTAGSGWNIAANGGLAFGSGIATIARTGGTNRVLCAVTSAAVQTSGIMMVVAAP